jgi:hypothetical protein
MIYAQELRLALRALAPVLNRLASDPRLWWQMTRASIWSSR